MIFDGPNKLIILQSANLSIRDLWSRWVDWFQIDDNSKYLPALEQVGGQSISGETSIPIYAFLVNGWRIRPQESSHTLNVSDGVILVYGGGDPFVNTLGSFVIRINYQQPVQAITVATGGGSSYTPSQIADAVFEKAVPASPTPGSFGDFFKNYVLTVIKFKVFK